MNMQDEARLEGERYIYELAVVRRFESAERHVRFFASMATAKIAAARALCFDAQTIEVRVHPYENFGPSGRSRIGGSISKRRDTLWRML